MSSNGIAQAEMAKHELKQQNSNNSNNNNKLGPQFMARFAIVGAN